jgi:hypothetical protein
VVGVAEEVLQYLKHKKYIYTECLKSQTRFKKAFYLALEEVAAVEEELH